MRRWPRGRRLPGAEPAGPAPLAARLGRGRAAARRGVVEGFSRVELPDHVVIVALTDDDRVVVVRSYKHGPRRASIMLPAGYIEPGEDPLLAAQRELREKTGYSAARWQPLGRFTVDGNRDCGEAHLFLAAYAERVAEPNAGDLEEMAVELIDFEALVARLGGGEIALLGVAAALGLAVAARRAER